MNVQSKATEWIYDPAKPVSQAKKKSAELRQSTLIKPPGSLGRLEEIAIQLASLQYSSSPSIEQPDITIFAADHGVVEEGISAFSQQVTLQMILNFVAGGAAISVLAKELGVGLQVINMGTANDIPQNHAVRQFAIDKGTKNICKEAAMSFSQLEQALATGKLIIEESKSRGTDIFIGGEMGIGNTTSAAALSCASLDQSAEKLAGLGTGLDADGLKRKVKTIKKALAIHKHETDDPLECLRRLGGFEIAALTGSYLRCAQLGIPVLIDGFICSAAALMALSINRSIKPWLIFSYESAEHGHQVLLESMQITPILKLDMRLGEGSGAAVCLPILKLACLVHNNMATFDEAGVHSE